MNCCYSYIIVKYNKHFFLYDTFAIDMKKYFDLNGNSEKIFISRNLKVFHIYEHYNSFNSLESHKVYLGLFVFGSNYLDEIVFKYNQLKCS